MTNELTSHPLFFCLKQAFHVVTKLPSVLIKSAAKKVEVAGKHLARFTHAASLSFGSDQSPPASARSLGNRTPQRGISALSDTSEAINNPGTDEAPGLPAIPSGGGDSPASIRGVAEADYSPKNSHHHHKTLRSSHHQHHHKSLFGSIFRRHKGPENADHEIQTKNTC